MKRYGIVDVGSNTLRAVIYEVEGDSFKQLISEKEYIGVLNYIRDGLLIQEGIDAICETLVRMNSLCQLLHCCEIRVFATASLRFIKNIEAVRHAASDVGVEIELLSGEQEAACDFYGLMAAKCDPDGVGLDLGGGSCQVVSYRDKALVSSASFPAGSLMLYTRFVRGIIPTQAEMKQIKRYVRETVQSHEDLCALGYTNLYAIGGTARAAAKLHRALTGQDRPISGYTLTLTQLDDLCSLMKALDMHGVRLMERVAPERITTIVPGMLAIRTICRLVGANQIEIVKSGVREGYLCHYLINKAP